MEEVISPEEHFDNNVINNYIEKVLSSKSRFFVKYNHYEIYELRLRKNLEFLTK